MLPRSGFLSAASKSNSWTLFPRSTTTRVSSGWEASISILLGMGDSFSRRARGIEAGLRDPTFRARDRRRRMIPCCADAGWDGWGKPVGAYRDARRACPSDGIARAIRNRARIMNPERILVAKVFQLLW